MYSNTPQSATKQNPTPKMPKRKRESLSMITSGASVAAGQTQVHGPRQHRPPMLRAFISRSGSLGMTAVLDGRRVFLVRVYCGGEKGDAGTGFIPTKTTTISLGGSKLGYDFIIETPGAFSRYPLARRSATRRRRGFHCCIQGDLAAGPPINWRRFHSSQASDQASSRLAMASFRRSQIATCARSAARSSRT